MITRTKLKCGEGTLASYKLEIQREFHKQEMASRDGGEVHEMSWEEWIKSFMSMKEMVKEL